MNPDVGVNVNASKNVLVTVTVGEFVGNGVDLDALVKMWRRVNLEKE